MGKMNKDEMVVTMRKALDWYAKEYIRYSDTELKEEMKADFKSRVSAYKQLLNEMYKKPPVTLFRRDIEKYIEDRKEDNWQ